MNRLFSLRNPVGVIGAVAAFVFSLSACGDDSGNSSYNANDFSLQEESMGELPNCSKNRSGDIAEVLGERKAYVCDNGRWEFDHDILDSVETEDDLPVCLSKNEGNSVWVVDESAVFACIDRKWEKREKEEPESSSATKKTASSSSEKQEISSSSVKKETSSSSKPLSSSSISQKFSSSVISSSSSVSSPVSSWSGGGAGAIGSITDSRDGQSYKTVTIGSQTWMAQNLNFETANSYCYNDSTKYCEKYGRLYMWGAAMDSAGTWSTNGKGCGYYKKCSPTYPVRGICPDGWHLPTEMEWNTLFLAVGGQSVAGTKLKSTSGWYSNGDGTDSFSFSALPAGCRGRGRNGIYSNEGNFAFFWGPSEYNIIEAYRMDLFNHNDDAILDYDYEDKAFSVRCLKDEAVEQKSSSSVTPQSSSSETGVSSSPATSSSSSVKSSSSSSATSSSSSVKSSSSSSATSSSSSVKSSSSSSATSSSSSVKSSSSSLAKSSSSSAKSSSSSVATSNSSSAKSSSSSSATFSSSSVKSSSSSKATGLLYGSLTDSRNGKKYKTVTIVTQTATGTLTWMAENLNYIPNNLYCYNNDKSNCSKYGALYTWAQAMDSAGTWSSYGKGCGKHKTCSPTYPVRGVCPSGWHLPTQYEWNALFKAVGDSSMAGTKLKSQSGWDSNGNGDDAFGFSALPAGFKMRPGYDDAFSGEGEAARFWSSVEYDPNEAYSIVLFYRSDHADLGRMPKDYGFSVRCVEDYLDEWR